MHTLKAYALSLALVPVLSASNISHADQINCKEFSLQQLQEIKQEHHGVLTRDETSLALEVAERSCRSLFKTVEEERSTIQSQAVRNDKTHWWEEDGKTKPNIKKAQQSGGK